MLGSHGIWTVYRQLSIVNRESDKKSRRETEEIQVKKGLQRRGKKHKKCEDLKSYLCLNERRTTTRKIENSLQQSRKREKLPTGPVSSGGEWEKVIKKKGSN